jgi:hypothetical protein
MSNGQQLPTTVLRFRLDPGCSHRERSGRQPEIGSSLTHRNAPMMALCTPSRASCVASSKGPLKGEGGTTGRYLGKVQVPTWTCHVHVAHLTLGRSART